ncbi:MAG: TPM domain-containing protein [Bacteroidales bacterium]|nr:TPM domain-containing protein [Bacteroidales bacterium]
MGASKYFSKEQQSQIVNAIKKAELNTSGEVRVHIESVCNEDVLDHAAWLFNYLKMHKTELRNGVLVYLAVESKKFAIIGDSGINAVVPSDFWDSTKEEMKAQFAQGRLTEGIAGAVLAAGVHLKTYFPYQTDDSNELSDEISFGK